MEIKKIESASLENKSHDFLLMGLVVALGFLFIIFEWSTVDVKKPVPVSNVDNFYVETLVPITIQKPVQPAPAVPAPPKVIIPKIKPVDNNVDTKPVDLLPTDVDVPVEPITAPVEEPIDEPDVFIVAEKAPSFPGGSRAMMEYLKNNIKYSASLIEMGIQGRVVLSFVVDTDGSIKDITVLSGAHEKLDAEAIRVVSSMPKWIPGENQGKKVRVRYNLPVTFRALN